MKSYSFRIWHCALIAAAMALGASGCGKTAERFSPGDEGLSRSTDYNSSRLGASSLAAALHSSSRLAWRPASFLAERFSAVRRAAPQATLPASARLNSTPSLPLTIAATPALICSRSSSILAEADGSHDSCRLLVVDSANSRLISYKMGSNGVGDASQLCNSQTINSAVQGGAIAIGIAGNDYYIYTLTTSGPGRR